MGLDRSSWPDSVRHWLDAMAWPPREPAREPAREPLDEAFQVDAIRQAMLEALGDTPHAPTAAVIRLRGQLRRAADAQALWYLRGELMRVTSMVVGERAARERIAALDARFDSVTAGRGIPLP